jgi:DNA polymerase-3 subunit delta'
MNDLRFDVVGAAGPKQYFSRLTQAAMSHAYLFSGNPGLGKKTFARALAQSLLCEAPNDSVLGYDGTCASCRLFTGENVRHPDFLEHNGVLKIGDSESGLGFYESEDLTARDLVRQLSMQSYSGGLRVLLLGDIDFATHHSANALLKFFEEPPRNVHLILTTSTPGRLLTTIRSRLIELRFPSLSSAEIAGILKARGRSEEEAKLGASLGQGSAARAIEALSADEDSLRGQVARWFFGVLDGNPPDETWVNRDTLDDGLEMLKTLVRDWVALSAAGPNAPLIAVDYADRLKALAQPSAAAGIGVISKLDDAARLARTNVSPSMVLELVRMTLTRV